jgi:hypothetical protein
MLFFSHDPAAFSVVSVAINATGIMEKPSAALARALSPSLRNARAAAGFSWLSWLLQTTYIIPYIYPPRVYRTAADTVRHADNARARARAEEKREKSALLVTRSRRGGISSLRISD